MTRRAPRPRGEPETGLTDPTLQFLQVLWRLEHALERASKRMEDAIGVSGPQRFALRVIGASPGIGAGDLAAALHLHPSTVTGMIQRLESGGLVKRVPHARDARRMHLHLTKAGARVNRPAAPGTVERVARVVLARCGPSKQRVAADVLEQFSRELMKL
jgi:DNA-binding MarR family transcriptional regulator